MVAVQWTATTGWLIFGTLAVLLTAVVWPIFKHHADDIVLAPFCYAVQAVGVITSVAWPTLAGFALSSLLLGMPFTAITFFAVQEVRRVRPWTPPSVIGLLTAIYGLGQIAGPPLASWLIHRSGAGAGFTLSLEIAATTLLVGSAVFVAMVRFYPVKR